MDFCGGEICPGTPLVSVQTFDTEEHEIQSLHWIPPPSRASDTEEAMHSTAIQARKDAAVLLEVWAADTGDLDQSTGLIHRISERCKGMDRLNGLNPLRQPGDERLTCMSTVMTQQLHAAKWIRHHLRSPEFSILQEPRIITHMLLMVVSMVKSAQDYFKRNCKSINKECYSKMLWW